MIVPSTPSPCVVADLRPGNPVFGGHSPAGARVANHSRAISTRKALHSMPDPTRIALCVTDLDIGGAERALVRLAKGLDPVVWRVEVFKLSRAGCCQTNCGTRACRVTISGAGRDATYACCGDCIAVSRSSTRR